MVVAGGGRRVAFPKRDIIVCLYTLLTFHSISAQKVEAEQSQVVELFRGRNPASCLAC